MGDVIRSVLVLLTFLVGIWIVSWAVGNGFYTGYNIARAGYELKLLKIFQENYKPEKNTMENN